MTQQILDSELKAKVRKDDELVLKIAQANQVKVDTVKRWLREDDVMLTTATNLAIIRAYFKLPAKQVLTQDKEEATAK